MRRDRDHRRRPSDRDGERWPAKRALETIGAPDDWLGDEVLTLTQGRAAHVSYASFTAVDLPSGRQHVLARTAGDVASRAFDHERVTILTGCCLFSNRSLRCVLVDGSAHPLASNRAGLPVAPVVRIDTDPRPSAYELETAIRQGRAVADLAATLSDTTEVDVVVDVPRVQYYLYLLPAFVAGLVTRDLMQRWFDLVDRRHAQVLNMFAERIGAITPTALLDPLAPVLRRSIDAGIVPDVRALAQAPQLLEDGIWRKLVDAIEVDSFMSLCNVSYVAEMFRAAGQTGMAVLVDGGREQRILDAARGLARRAGLPLRCIGLYLLERVQVHRDGRLFNLFFDDPGYVVDAGGGLVDVRDVVTSLYERDRVLELHDPERQLERLRT